LALGGWLVTYRDISAAPASANFGGKVEEQKKTGKKQEKEKEKRIEHL